MDRIADVIAGITTIALVTTIVAHRNTSRVVTSIGNAYQGALKAAMGQSPGGHN